MNRAKCDCIRKRGKSVGQTHHNNVAHMITFFRMQEVAELGFGEAVVAVTVGNAPAATISFQHHLVREAVLVVFQLLRIQVVHEAVNGLSVDLPIS